VIGLGIRPNGIMDNLISIKFGDKLIDSLKIKADSLFFVKTNDGTFEDWEVDNRALRKAADENLGGDYIINYLNHSLNPNSKYRYESNCVNLPYFVIQFTVNKDGTTKETRIIERHRTEKFVQTERAIISEVNEIKDWIPATIQNKPIAARFQIGVAIGNNYRTATNH
jgi:hypothetical protein